MRRRLYLGLMALLMAASLAGGAPVVVARPVGAPPNAALPGLQGGFAAFWQAHDGALLFGAPLSPEFWQAGVRMQVLERARLEWHPDYPPGRQIILGRLGAELTADRTFPPIPAFPSGAERRYFAATGHGIGGAFLQFWATEGGLPIFGYPLSEEFTEDGRTVQYFERARLESHPELATAGTPVLPAPLGALAPGAGSAAAVMLEPPALQQGHTLLIKVVPQAGATVVGGTLAGSPLRFSCCLSLAPAGGRALPWALAGAASDATASSLPLVVLLRQADGSRVAVTRTVPLRPYPYPTRRVSGAGTPLSVSDAEHALLAGLFAGRSGPPRWSGIFRPPLAGLLSITSPFGERRIFDAPPESVHDGVDWGEPTGTLIFAPAPGTVVWAAPLTLRGNATVIDHGAGVFTLYAHQSAFRVRVGQQVNTGDLIGLVGMTGNAAGPHLHWEVHVSGTGVQPLDWLARTFP